LQLFYTDSQFFKLDLVEARGVVDQRSIAMRPHVVNNRRHNFHQLRVKRN
jgi:hypothetical protein